MGEEARVYWGGGHECTGGGGDTGVLGEGGGASQGLVVIITYARQEGSECTATHSVPLLS